MQGRGNARTDVHGDAAACSYPFRTTPVFAQADAESAEPIACSVSINLLARPAHSRHR